MLLKKEKVNNRPRVAGSQHKVEWRAPFSLPERETPHRGWVRALGSPGPSLNEKFLGI